MPSVRLFVFSHRSLSMKKGTNMTWQERHILMNLALEAYLTHQAFLDLYYSTLGTL